MAIKRKWNYLCFDALFCTVFSFIVSGILYLFVVNLSILDPFERAFTDFSFTDIYHSKILDKRVSNDIIIVNIKHENRYQIAKAIDMVSSHNPKVIGLDIIFKDLKNSYYDSILKGSFSNSDNLVFSFYYDGDNKIENHPYFRLNDYNEGFINVELENQNSVIRDFVGFRNDSFSFASKIAMASGYSGEKNVKNILQSRIPINYFGNLDSFLTFDIEEILSSNTIPTLNNAIVLFGYLGTPTGNPYDIEDKHFTPLNEKFVGRSTPDMHGVVIQANIIKMLIQENFIKKIPNFISFTIAFVLCFFITLLGFRLKKKNELVYDLTIKFLQLIISILLLYAAIKLIESNVYIYITPILILSLVGLGMIGYYTHLLNFLNKRFKWKSQFLDS